MNGDTRHNSLWGTFWVGRTWWISSAAVTRGFQPCSWFYLRNVTHRVVLGHSCSYDNSRPFLFFMACCLMDFCQSLQLLLIPSLSFLLFSFLLEIRITGNPIRLNLVSFITLSTWPRLLYSRHNRLCDPSVSVMGRWVRVAIYLWTYREAVIPILKHSSSSVSEQ